MMRPREAITKTLVAGAGVLAFFSPLIAVTGGGAILNGVETPEADKTKIDIIAPKHNRLNIQCIGDMGHKALQLSYAGKEFRRIPVEHCAQTDYKP